MKFDPKRSYYFHIQALREIIEDEALEEILNSGQIQFFSEPLRHSASRPLAHGTVTLNVFGTFLINGRTEQPHGFMILEDHPRLPWLLLQLPPNTVKDRTGLE